MGQTMNTMESYFAHRVPYEEDSNNGYIIDDKYIPEELILEMLCWVDYKSLLKCHLVCKRWNVLIRDYVWKKKAEMVVGHPLPVDHEAPWTMYYYICTKNFGRNLIKNHSGKEGAEKRWTIIKNGGDGWAVECPPVGVPELPDDPVFQGKLCCFVTSHFKCWKYQMIDLVQEGISEYLLDSLQPPIKCSEYYSCRWDCPAIYVCTIELLTDKNVILMSYNFSKTLEEEEQNVWHKFEHELENYGKGLRKIRFSHGGKDRRFWAGHYGSKMAGACVQLGMPRLKSTESTKSAESAESAESTDNEVELDL